MSTAAASTKFQKRPPFLTRDRWYIETYPLTIRLDRLRLTIREVIKDSSKASVDSEISRERIQLGLPGNGILEVEGIFHREEVM